MRRAIRWTATFGIGALLGAVALAGMSAAKKPPGWDRLDLTGYCRSQHGVGAVAFQPPNVEAWECSVRRNGVWGLEPVDLDAACDWQHGEDAQLEQVELPPNGDTKGQMLCRI